MATLTSRLILQLTDGITGKARGIAGALAGIDRGVSRFNRSQAAGVAMARGFAGRLVAMGAGFIGVREGYRGTAGAAMKFEEAFADVRKVVDGTDEQLGNIRNQILDLSRALPTSAEGIAAIFAAAGQSNIPIEELGKFSEMVAKVAVAWDTTEGETSEALAKIKTQLSMNVTQIGLFADAINHLSNNTAAQAPDLVDFSKRVAANGEMFGFSATQTLAFGGAMVAMGAQTEVAATSFRNMGRALTMGERATKQQRIAFQKLGIDSVKTAQNMQKNALGTTLDVIERIQKLPEWQRISIASALFGDEARALMPVISNTTELRRQLAMVGDEANYAGSAYQEYMVRADTAANALAIIGNKVRATFIGIGDSMLPTIKEAGLGLGDVLDTLGERASIFDRIDASVRGFVKGLGYEGGVRETIGMIGDLLFGKADASGAADQLGRLFEQFRQGGVAVREFWDVAKDSPVLEFIESVSGYGFSLAIASVGFGLFAGAITKLARALFFLTGAKAAVGIIAGLAKAGAWLTGASSIGGVAAGTAAGSAAGAGVAAGGFIATWGKWFKSLGISGALGSLGSLVQGMGDTPGDTFDKQVENQRKAREGLQRMLGIGDESFSWKRFFLGKAADPNFSFRDHMRMAPGSKALNEQGSGTDVTEALRNTIFQTKPTGTQDVNIINPVRPNVNVSVTVHATSSDPDAVGGATGSAVRAEVEGLLSDGGY